MTGGGLFGEPWDSLISAVAVDYFVIAVVFVFKPSTLKDFAKCLRNRAADRSEK